MIVNHHAMRAAVVLLCLGLAGCRGVETWCACTEHHQMKAARVTVGMWARFEGDFNTVLRICQEHCAARPQKES